MQTCIYLRSISFAPESEKSAPSDLEFESYILTKVKWMAKETKELHRTWLWIGAAVLLVVVFFSARSFTRDKLPVKVARVARESLTSTLSTNAHVEPETKYEY